MNLDNWDNLTPAERDALVAENVMGWRNRRTLQSGTIIWVSGPDTCDERYTGEITPWAYTSLWQPTREISAAMEVLDKMTADLWQYEIGGHNTWHKATFWKDVCVGDADEGDERLRLTGHAYGPHRADNICLAALKAKETDK